MNDYDAFLRSKVCLAPKEGVAFADVEINPALKQHQQAAVRWALAGGRRAIFGNYIFNSLAEK